MKLSDEVFLDMVRAMVAQTPGGFKPAEARLAGDAPDVERRDGERYRLVAPLPYSRYGTLSARQVVQLQDVSHSGLGVVVVNTVMAPGEQLVLHPPSAAAPKQNRKRAAAPPLELLCTVRAVRVRRDGSVRVGAEFTAAQDTPMLEQVVAMRSSVAGSLRFGDRTHASEGPTLWGRTSGRREMCPTQGTRGDERQPHLLGRGLMYVVFTDGSHAPMEHVQVHNVSAGGVGFLRPDPLEPGMHVMMRIPRADQRPITRLCEVTRVDKHGGQHLVGARFIEFGSRPARTWLGRLVGSII